MLSATKECKNKIKSNSKVIAKGNIVFSDETVVELVGADFRANTMSFNHAVSSSSTFDIGSAIIGRMAFTLNNSTGKFDSYDFSGSNITPFIGIPLEESTEWIKKGVYNIDQPSVYDANISLTAYDNMSKFQKPYSDVTTVYPATCFTIISDICLECGVTLKGTSFDNSTFSISERPDDENMSCLDVIGYISQICGCYALCDDNGYLEIKWYPEEELETVALNGGSFDSSNPYATGDDVDGGNFIDWTSGDNYDAGLFTQETITFDKNFSVSVNTDNVVITGIRVTEMSNGYSDEDSPSTLLGTDDYAIEIKDNPFVESGKTAEIALYLIEKIGGMVFRPYTLQTQSNPLITPGDCCIVQDRNGNTYNSLITNVSYRIGSSLSVACYAESPERHKASCYSELAKSQTNIKHRNEKELSTYDKQVQLMNQLAVNALGYYQTVVTDDTDNSKITYLHDKSTLAESTKIYKMTSDGFFLSQDGGATYTAGFDANGNAVLNILSAVGIVCDWIKGGTLTLGGSDNINGVMSVLDSSGMETVRADKNGIYAKNGTFEGKIISTDAVITGGTIKINSNPNTNDVIKLNFGQSSISMGIGEVKCSLNSLYAKIGFDGLSTQSGIYSSEYGTSAKIAQTLEVGMGTTLKSTLSVSGNTSITGKLDVDGNVTLSGGLNLDTSYGSFSCAGSASFTSLFSCSGTVTLSGSTTITGRTKISAATELAGDVKLGASTSSSIGFFGSTGNTRRSVSVIYSTSSATASSNATKINEIINALKAYNLLG